VRIDIAWWDLEGTSQTIDSLGAHLREGTVARWAEVPGLRLKCWIADRDHNRWGAVMLWETERPPLERLPPNEATSLIGRPPSLRAVFEVEATAEPSEGMWEM